MHLAVFVALTVIVASAPISRSTVRIAAAACALMSRGTPIRSPSASHVRRSRWFAAGATEAERLRAACVAVVAKLQRAEALKQRLKQTSTALQLDSGAAISLSQEAQQLLNPVLQLVALSEVRD